MELGHLKETSTAHAVFTSPFVLSGCRCNPARILGCHSRISKHTAPRPLHLMFTYINTYNTTGKRGVLFDEEDCTEETYRTETQQSTFWQSAAAFPRQGDDGYNVECAASTSR